MRPVVITRTLATADPDGIVDGGSAIAGGAFTLNGALVSGGVANLGTSQRKVLITSAINLSAVNFTITGTNESGAVISEVLAGPNATTATSALDYSTVISVTVDALAGVFATGVLTFAANATDGDTVTLGSTTYTLQDTLIDSANNVHIGGSASDTIDNLIAAITAGAGAGTDYGTGTVANAEATAAAGAGDTMDATALLPGSAGNSIDSTETGAQLSWGAATLASGADGADIGTSGVGASIPLLLDRYISPLNVGISLEISGTANVSVQETMDRDTQTLPGPFNWQDVVDTGLVGATASVNGSQPSPATALRLLTNSGTGTCIMTIVQAGPNG